MIERVGSSAQVAAILARLALIIAQFLENRVHPIA
jgi:hypothetical protein